MATSFASDMKQTLAAMLEALRDNHVTGTTTSRVTEYYESIEKAHAGAVAQLERIKQNRNLSLEGKKDLSSKALLLADSAVKEATQSIMKELEKETRFHEERTVWQSTAPDREGQLANARADLKDLLASAPPGKRAERLEFAVRNGSPAMRELVLAEKYAERVLWPSLEDGNIDAAAWANTAPKLLQEYHPGGEKAQRSLTALHALNTKGKGLRDVVNNVGRTAIQELGSTYGVAPAAVGGGDS